MIAAILILPVSLFAYTAAVTHRALEADADAKIAASLDVLEAHFQKMFKTADLLLRDVNADIGRLPDNEIQANEWHIHERLQQLAVLLPEFESVLITDRNGRRLASGILYPVGGLPAIADRDYFRALAQRDVGVYVGEVRQPRVSGNRFFSIGRRRPTVDGAFNGVVQLSITTKYVEDFFGQIGRSPRSFFALFRDDGVYLARYPRLTVTHFQITDKSHLWPSLVKNPIDGRYVAASVIDSVHRWIGYRKLAGFPVYMSAGIEVEALESQWRSVMAGHLVFGIPATMLLLAITTLAHYRTKRLYDEAQRRESAEEALRAAQRREAMGQLTGGVAHDFNNLLMIILGNIQRLRRNISDEKAKRQLQMIESAAQRGETLTKQLLSFSRKQAIEPASIDLVEQLPKILELLNRSLRGDIEVQTSLPATTWPIYVDLGEFEFALLNLAVNARDAMPQGGKLAVESRNVHLNGSETPDHIAGDFVALAISDSGQGIDPDVLPRIFEPFFTTKEIGKGSGLGLSQVYGFATQSGGTVAVSSALGRGTTITLYLPRSHQSPPIQAGQETLAAASRHGTILLVEDNPDVAEVNSANLRELGYGVDCVSNADAALERLKTQDHYDLVLSDVLMPGSLSGLELARIIRKRRPGLPVILTTGYGGSDYDGEREGFRILRKPYDLATLDKGIRQELEKIPR